MRAATAQAIELPVEGTETTAVGDNPEVLSFMTRATDQLEVVRVSDPRAAPP